MAVSVTTELRSEWRILHRDHERYEAWSLVIKLFAFAAFGLASLNQLATTVTGIMLMMLWILEAIWKTFQGRIANRILMVEQAISRVDDVFQPLQLYSSWERERPTAVTLLFSYGRCALRPTVLFPYALLVVALCIFV